jgi:hypothetical protein
MKKYERKNHPALQFVPMCRESQGKRLREDREKG